MSSSEVGATTPAILIDPPAPPTSPQALPATQPLDDAPHGEQADTQQQSVGVEGGEEIPQAVLPEVQPVPSFGGYVSPAPEDSDEDAGSVATTIEETIVEAITYAHKLATSTTVILEEEVEYFERLIGMCKHKRNREDEDGGEPPAAF